MSSGQTRIDTTPKEKARDPAKWKSLEDRGQGRKEKLRQLDDFFAEARAYARRRRVRRILPSCLRGKRWCPVVRGEIPVTIHADDERQIRRGGGVGDDE